MWSIHTQPQPPHAYTTNPPQKPCISNWVNKHNSYRDDCPLPQCEWWTRRSRKKQVAMIVEDPLWQPQGTHPLARKGGRHSGHSQTLEQMKRQEWLWAGGGVDPRRGNWSRRSPMTSEEECEILREDSSGWESGEVWEIRDFLSIWLYPINLSNPVPRILLKRFCF